jgi:hypothetical protein
MSAFFKSTAENVITLTIELFLKKKGFEASQQQTTKTCVDNVIKTFSAVI